MQGSPKVSTNRQTITVDPDYSPTVGLLQAAGICCAIRLASRIFAASDPLGRTWFA